MEIDDILASVSTPHTLPGQPTPSSTDLAVLTRAWVNERCAPELLPYPTGLMDRVQARVRAQIELVEQQTGDMDPKINFKLIVVQTELERVKFLVRTFVRTRLAKIDRHAAHCLSITSETGRSGLLSETERAYAAQHQSLLSHHFSTSFLSAFPPQLQRLDDSAGGISMVEPPDADGAVLVRALVDTTRPVSVPGTDIDFDMSRGDVWVTRWSAVRELVHKGEAELV